MVNTMIKMVIGMMETHKALNDVLDIIDEFSS